MTNPPSGQLVQTADGNALVVSRTFRAPIEDVWASVTEPERTARWFGTWKGDAAPGRMINEARLILICGLPGSGKTTFAKELAPQVPAVRLSPDEWKHDLGIDYYDEQRRVQLENRLWQLGQELLTLGQSVILENGFWTREERDELRLAARTSRRAGGAVLPGSAGRGAVAAARASER